MTDSQLLQVYAEERSESAFTELVRRHLDFVYSAALRMVGDQHHAQDVTQGVFVVLAKDAGRLKDHPLLAGWLHLTTRNIASKTIRTEMRRRQREQKAVAMNELDPAQTEDAWKTIAPELDEVLGDLDEADRDALLLRYFEQNSAREMGQKLGISEDAAQKRVSRAVDRLRELFSRRKITIGTASLLAILSAHAVKAAPAGLAVTIPTAIHTSAALTATKVIAMTTFQKTLITLTLTAFAGVGVYEAHQASQVREQNRTLQRQQAALDAQVQQLEMEHDFTKRQLDALTAENASLRSDSSIQEVSRLRAQVKQLQAAQSQESKKSAASDDPFTRSVMALSARASELYQHLQQMPDKNIPELALLDTSDWIKAAQTAKFDSEADTRQSLQKLRALAKNKVPIGSALYAYVQANNGDLPTGLSQLQPFFDKSTYGDFGLDDATFNAIIDRYQLLHTGKAADYPRGSWFVVEKAPVDKDYDSRVKFGLGTSSIYTTGIGESGDPDDPSYGSTTP